MPKTCKGSVEWDVEVPMCSSKWAFHTAPVSRCLPLTMKNSSDPDRHRRIAGLHLPQIADPLQLLLHRAAAGPDLLEAMGCFERDRARPHPRRHHRDGKAGSFLATVFISKQALTDYAARFPSPGTKGDLAAYARTHFVQFTTPTGNSVSTASSFSTRSISTPAQTPSIPSYAHQQPTPRRKASMRDARIVLPSAACPDASPRTWEGRLAARGGRRTCCPWRRYGLCSLARGRWRRTSRGLACRRRRGRGATCRCRWRCCVGWIRARLWRIVEVERVR